jgi:hypothetical protein
MSTPYVSIVKPGPTMYRPIAGLRVQNQIELAEGEQTEYQLAQIDPMADHVASELACIESSHGHRVMLCAKSGNAIVGLCEASKASDEDAVVTEFVTSRDFRGNFAAIKLIEFALLFANGARLHIPETSQNNGANKAVLHEAGFTQYCKTKMHLSAPGVECMTLQRDSQAEIIDIIRYMRTSYVPDPSDLLSIIRLSLHALGEKPKPQDLWNFMRKKSAGKSSSRLNC